MAVLLVLAAVAAPAAHAEPLKLVANEGLAVQLVAAQLLREIYQRAGLQMTVEPLPPARATMLMAAGQKDGEVARVGAYLQQHPLVRVEPAYYTITSVAYTRQDFGKTLRTSEDLLPYKVAVIRGVTHAKLATQGHPAVSEVASDDALFKMLVAQRVEVALDTGLNGGVMLDKPIFHGLKASGTVATLELYHYLHPRHKAQAARLGAVIAQMKASGELDKLTSAAETDVRKRVASD